MKKTIGIIGPTISGNKGAAAMFESAVQTLEQKYGEHNIEFILFSYYYRRDRKYKVKDNVKVMSATPLYLALIIVPLSFLYMILRPFGLSKLLFNREIKALSRCNVMLDMGGISFVDGREKYLIFNIAIMLPSIFMKVPLVKCAQAMGTFNNKINRFAAKIFIPKAAAVISRGHITSNNLKEIKIKNFVEKADYAFVLDIEQHLYKSIEYITDKIFFNNEKRIVGICPSSVIDNYSKKHSLSYISIVQEFINEILKQNYRVLILPHSILKDTSKTKNNDFGVCEEIYKIFNNNDDVMFIRDDLDSQELRALISKTDFFIASRFHSMISSLATKVPTLVVGWSHKYREVLKMLKMEDYAIDYKTISTDILLTNFYKLVNEENSIKQKFDENLASVVSKAKEHVDVIDYVMK